MGLNCLIIGAGGVGIALGAALKASGGSVSFLSTGETKRAIDEDGIHRTGLFGPLDFPKGTVDTYDIYEGLPDDTFDYVLITAKTMANEEISRQLGAHARVLKKTGVIVIVQNGWGNDGPYLRHFKKEQVYSARIITGFRRTAPNISDVTVHTQPVLLGSLYGCDNSILAPLARAIDPHQPDCQLTDEIGKALWAKMLYNCTLNPLGAVLRMSYGELSESDHSVCIMNRLIEELFSVMYKAGFSTYWDTPEQYQAVFYDKLVPDTYYHRSSTLQDIEGKRKTEIDTLTGRVLELAEAHSVPVPSHAMLYRMIKTLEEQF